MNQKLSFQDVASLLSAATAQTEAFAEDFIKELFAAVSDALAAGESVKIKGLGEFKPSPESPDKLTFIPDEALAEKVNAPFSQFAPAQLNPGVTDEQLKSVENVDVTTQDDTAVSVSEPVTVTETEVPVESEVIEEEVPVFIPAEEEPSVPEESIEVVETTSPAEPEVIVAPVVPSVPEIIPIEEDEEEIFDSKEQKSRPAVPPPFEPEAPAYDAEPEPEETQSKSGGFGMGFLVGLIVGLAVGAAAMFFYATSLMPTRTAVTEPDEVATLQDELAALMQAEEASGVAETPDTVGTPDVAPEPEPTPEPAPAATPAAPVTDKVKAGYLMPKMAQKHYGNQVFWVYIYEENKSKISNPNNLTAGQELVIPDPAKYGIDANDPKSIARARDKEAEIFNKK